MGTYRPSDEPVVFDVDMHQKTKGPSGAWIFVAALMTVLALAAAGWGVAQSNQRANEGAASHTALCAFKFELQSRVPRSTIQVERSKQFLADHPNGIPGISANLIKQGIADDQAALSNLKRTIRVLQVLKCN